MKRIINITSLLIIGIGIISLSCNDDNELALSEEDRIALKGMYESYENAKIENNSTLIAIEQEDSEAIHMHDSLFHHYEGEFEMHHGNYMHDNEHDNHHHDGHGMHMMGSGGMMHDDWQDGHHHEDHELMDELVHEHNQAVH